MPERQRSRHGRYPEAGAARASGLDLALQLPFSEVSALSGSLVSSAPERPCDDVCGLNTPSRESDGNAANFLDRPTDQWRRGDALAFAGGRRLVFLGGGLARCRIAAIMAKASITRDT